MLSALAADHVQRPRNRGRFEGYSHYGVGGTVGEGPATQIWLLVEAGMIRRAAYETHGCPSSIAAASLLCTLITGREFARAQTLTAEELLIVLQGLPEGKGMFANLAVDALRSARPEASHD